MTDDLTEATAEATPAGDGRQTPAQIAEQDAARARLRVKYPRWTIVPRPAHPTGFRCILGGYEFLADDEADAEWGMNARTQERAPR